MCSHNICIHQIKFDEILFLLFHPTEGAGFHFNLMSQVISYGHGGTVNSPNHTLFLGKLEQAVNQYFVHIFRLFLFVCLV